VIAVLWAWKKTARFVFAAVAVLLHTPWSRTDAAQAPPALANAKSNRTKDRKAVRIRTKKTWRSVMMSAKKPTTTVFTS
jgi:hypothetical protein